MISIRYNINLQKTVCVACADYQFPSLYWRSEITSSVRRVVDECLPEQKIIVTDVEIPRMDTNFLQLQKKGMYKMLIY